MPNTPDPLQGLRDVHVPDPISWWPPAPGWWMVVLGLIIIGSVFLWVRSYRQKTQSRRDALAQLGRVKKQYAQEADDQLALTEISHLLRRYALAMFPRSQVAGLSGRPWLEFLDRAGGTTQFTNGPGQLLQSGPYQSGIMRSAEDLFPITERWIQRARISVGKR